MKKIGRSDAHRDASLHRIKNPKPMNRNANLKTALNDCLFCFEPCANSFCNETCKLDYKKRVSE